MTTIQRKACLALRGLAFGHHAGARSFGKAMIRRADDPAWFDIDLTPTQLTRLAKCVRKFRRQIRNPHLLFWAQRVLAERNLFAMEAASEKAD